jgi:hypothetical protein
MTPTKTRREVMSAADMYRWLRTERRLGREPAPAPLTPATACLEHPFLRATRVLRGIGPLCSGCITAQERATKHRQRLLPSCGCGGERTYCPFAASLYRRAHIAHARMLETPEADQQGRARLALAYTSMMLALRGHHMGAV